MKSKHIIITGASGTGKTTLAMWLEQTAGYKRIITYTTRPPRKNENNGIEYRFITDSEFHSKKDNGEFFETTRYDNYEYGVSNDCIEEIDNIEYGYSSYLPRVIVMDPVGAVLLSGRLRDRGLIVWLDIPSSIPENDNRRKIDGLNRTILSNIDTLRISDYVHPSKVLQVIKEIELY